MSTYRVTCLTPTLVGSGGHLAPIDYMIWRDQVNVLDHARIVRMWSKSPRLESYLTQVRRAERQPTRGSWWRCGCMRRRME